MSGRVLARQGFLFALFGVAATAVHVAVALASHHLLGVSPLGSNFMGYAAAVGVSYFGNAQFTFRQPAARGAQFLRFVVLSLGGLALNQAITHVVTDRLGYPFALALVLSIAVVPPATFVVAKLWAFRPPQS